MNRYYVEFAKTYGIEPYIYVYAYSEEQVRVIFGDYELVSVDQTD